MLNDAKGFSRIIIACGRTDLRRGIDGLAAVVQEQFQLDPTEKNVLSCSAGRFRWLRTQEEAMAITREQFDLLTQSMTIVSTIRQVNPKRL